MSNLTQAIPGDPGPFSHTVSLANVGKSNAYGFVFAALSAFWLLSKFVADFKKFKAPFAGYRAWWEPKFLVGLRFSRWATPQVLEGYQKYKDAFFKVSRNDSDILVISNKYVDELRSLPDEKISAIRAHIKNLLGYYSTTNILLESELHTRMLQTKLTPNLGSFIPVIEDELRLAMELEMPKGLDQWQTTDIHHLVLRIVARISARVFVSPPTCRDEEWLYTSIKYTENVFATVMVLRRLPAFLHPVVAPLLPSYWAIHKNLNTAKKIIIPMVNERRKLEASGDPDYQKPNDMLQWMMDAANSNDGQPHKLAHRQLLLSLASIHTTTMAATHAIYDMCARPDYFEPIREEAVQVLKEDGGWKKTTLNKMRKLDSFMKESQRINPPSLLAFNRITREDIKLHDGTVLPKDTHFSVASAPIIQDNEVEPGADEFDGFRYSRKRENPDEVNKHQFATTDSNNLHFGHGKYSCPGRFFASNEIKMIMAHLLMGYEFKYPEGKGRPENLTADENFYPDPSARVMMRAVADAPEEMFAVSDEPESEKPAEASAPVEVSA